MESNLRMACSDRRPKFGKRGSFWTRHQFQKALKIASLTTLPLLLVGCSDYVKSVQNPCEVRVYHQQVLLAHSNSVSILKSGAVPSPASNSIFFQDYLLTDLWLIQDYVRAKQWYPISEPKTTNYAKISLDTTFLIVAVDDPLTFKFKGKNYFDGAYSEIGFDKICPIFIGQRNGKFALATIRTLGGSRDERDRRDRCDKYATLAFFGISKEYLKNHSDFVSNEVFGPPYDRYAIRTHLESKKSCGGDSLKNLRVAAEEGDADAQYNLGGTYLSGEGGLVARDDVEALKWIMLAANQGHAEAQALLGDMYGPGSREDDKEAAKWYRLAAKQGIEYAQSNLGQMYAEGKGIEKDYVQSYLWLSISETNQDRRIVNLKKSLARLMTDDQIAQAELLAAKCVETNFQDCD